MAKLKPAAARRVPIATVAAWLLAITPAQGSTAIDEILRSAVDEGLVPGVVAMVATADETLYSGAYGLSDVAGNVAMREDTLFSIASMTKPVTSVAMMQLVEQDKVALDAPISDYLDDFAPRPVLTSLIDGQPKYSDARHTPTVRQLLSHTSGFGYAFWNERLFTITDFNNRDPRNFLTEPLVFEPGTRWHYSSSTDWVGEIVTRISGMNLETYFASFITQPLGMSETSYIIREEQRRRVATTHQRGSDGELEETANGSFPTPTHFGGGAGLYSTAGDYVRFMQMILRGGENVLGSDSIAAMATNQIGTLEAGVLETQLESISNDVDVFPESVDRFGLGFLLNGEDIPGRRRQGSLMWAGLRNTYFWIDGTSGLCGVLLTQVLPFYDDDVIALLARFETAAYAEFANE